MHFGSLKRDKKLLGIVPSSFQGIVFGIGDMFCQGCCFRVLLEELLTILITIFGSEILILPIGRLRESFQQDVIMIEGERCIPFRPP